MNKEEIEVAKQSGTGIILVNSKKYEQVSRNEKTIQ